jgi:hypothetical protein
MKMALTLIGDSEKPSSIRFIDFGNPDDLVVVQPAANEDVDAIAGQYRSETTGTDATIAGTNDAARLTTVGRFGSAEFTLECLADRIWRAASTSAMPWGGTVLFDDDGGGFRFSSSRTPALRFRRCA